MGSLISGMAFVRLSAPDLDLMERFLLDFGMISAGRDDRRMYMRGTGPSPYIHVTEKGPPGIISYGYDVDDRSVLEDVVSKGLAERIEALDGPGGGERVIVREPSGAVLELIAGRVPVDAIPPGPRVRSADGVSKALGPARIKRISHAATMTPDPKATLDWYKQRISLLLTDELYVESQENLLGQFLRVDRGEELVDHHVIFVLKGEAAGMHHVSYEVEAVDDIFFGLNHLDSNAHDHVRGIGRHALGSQIFDYWMSPFAQMHEHWHAFEKMNAQSASNSVKIGSDMAHDTGGKPPERFTKQSTPFVSPA